MVEVRSISSRIFPANSAIAASSRSLRLNEIIAEGSGFSTERPWLRVAEGVERITTGFGYRGVPAALEVAEGNNTDAELGRIFSASRTMDSSADVIAVISFDREGFFDGSAHVLCVDTTA
eukprot:TRINITY_DN6811_c0_g1_i1.p2 TRINITY_DN6811_c0_g1~~TRINITY_DN6811_c0_g1_i1.p2  ORF type:complete len:120 (+),score=3.48 TRINITY_DN6811_c0_g1_i1:287-646(+)